MGDRRLSALELLSFESDVLETVTFDKVIEQFASIKSRACLTAVSAELPVQRIAVVKCCQYSGKR